MAEERHRQLKRDYPFSAIVENGLAKDAIRCALASPDILSLLICGPKGTGKSVIARSVSTICSDKNIVVIPAGSTEDQIFGGVDIEETIKTGKRCVSDNILRRADGNILLAENINLMPSSLALQLLNVVESGINEIERDGISFIQPCDTLLIATADAEEAPLSEHILDRFDICVFAENIDSEESRYEVVVRRSAYERNPAEFVSKYRDDDSKISDNISRAETRVRYTRVPDGYISAISEVCAQLNVVGHRGDISVMNASRAFAALNGRDVTNLDDLKLAAAICLEHRRRDPDESNEPQKGRNESDDGGKEDSPESDGHPSEGEPDSSDGPSETSNSNEQSPPPTGQSDGQEEIFSIGESFRIADFMPDERCRLSQKGSGKHSPSATDDRMGRCIGSRIPSGSIDDIDLLASIRVAAPNQIYRDRKGLAVALERRDIREKVRQKRRGRDILFLVDGSGSLGAQRRMVAVKGAILSMLTDAYQKRDSIGMAVFRMDRAEEVLPLTRSILKAYKVLADIPTGGRTPLTHGLLKGFEILNKNREDGQSPVMIILSDGRCNVPFSVGSDPVGEMLSVASSLADSDIRFIVIDTEIGRMRFGLALELCKALNGTYLRLDDLSGEYIERSVKLIIDG